MCGEPCLWSQQFFAYSVLHTATNRSESEELKMRLPLDTGPPPGSAFDRSRLQVEWTNKAVVALKSDTWLAPGSNLSGKMVRIVELLAPFPNPGSGKSTTFFKTDEDASWRSKRINWFPYISFVFFLSAFPIYSVSLILWPQNRSARRSSLPPVPLLLDQSYAYWLSSFVLLLPHSPDQYPP